MNLTQLFKDLPKLTEEDKLNVASQETLLDSIKLLKEIKTQKNLFWQGLQNEVEFCKQLRSQLLLKNLRKI